MKPLSGRDWGLDYRIGSELPNGAWSRRHGWGIDYHMGSELPNDVSRPRRFGEFATALAVKFTEQVAFSALEVEYDPEYGHPVLVNLDYQEHAADDEVTIEVAELAVLERD